MSPLDISKPIEDSINLFSEQFRVNDILIEKKLERKSLQVVANWNQLQQVCVNIISNSRDAILAKRKKAKRNNEKDCLKITIKLSKDKKFVQLEFKDNGIGMSKQTQEKIFRPFFTTKSKGEGTGLGLSIVQQIVNNHKGRIELQSNLGIGTIISIFLPVT